MLQELNNILAGKENLTLFVGIGNVLKQDDGAGVYISSRIKETDHIRSITAEVSLENYIGKINSIGPDTLILIDCVDLGKSPGSCELLEVSRIGDLTFNTHNISIKRLADFFDFPVFVLGIQPVTIDFGENISYLVKEEANKIIKLINKQEVQNGN
jgi:hydrogenase 3 maturation protease